MSLPSHLRAYRDLSKDEHTRESFNVPKADDAAGGPGKGMEINAVLSIEGEAVFVRSFPSLVSFLSLGFGLRAGREEAERGPSWPGTQQEDYQTTSAGREKSSLELPAAEVELSVGTRRGIGEMVAPPSVPRLTP